MIGREIFIYAAACYCEDCGNAIRARIAAAGNAPAEPDKESTYDSDDYPKGPYSEGGGEADSPQHCDACGVFLENPLTRAGVDYLRETLAEVDARRGPSDLTAEWRAFYSDELAQLHAALA